jgi:hypothetical protein
MVQRLVVKPMKLEAAVLERLYFRMREHLGM